MDNLVAKTCNRKKFNFEKFYNYLIAYKQEVGNLYVPTAYVTKDDYKLGRTINHIRSGYIKLSDQQIQRLNNIEFVWDASIHFNFDTFYSNLIAYKQEFGNLYIPFKYKTKNKYNLGSRVNNVRTGQVKLSNSQIEQLNKIGFVWDATKVFDFDTFYNYLLNYKQQFGDVNVNYYYTTEDNYPLGARVSCVRSDKVKVSDEQKQKLNDIGFVWNAKITFDFETFYNYLLAYKNQFGNTKVPQHYVTEDDYKLGKRVSKIRLGIIHLTDLQIQQLNDIGFIWNARKTKLENNNNI